MKKIISLMLALAACLVLTIPALAAGQYVYVRDPWSGGYYYNSWGGYYVGPWKGNYAYGGPTRSGYVYGMWPDADKGMENFQKSRDYVSGTYQDVPAGAWYEDGVKTLWELGFAADEAYFRPKSGLTLGEIVSLAARIHATYQGWSIPADMSDLQYALNVGIVTAGQYDDYGNLATRRSFAAIMAKALPTEALRGINVIMDGAIPDVPSSDPGAWGIYTLYRAGVLVGSDIWGSFCPNDGITRASAAVIAARMLDPAQRRSTSLTTEAVSIILSQTSMLLSPGQSRTLTARVYPANAASQTVTWASSEPRTAEVDEFGNVTAVHSGSALIIATTIGGVMATCKVDVASPY